MDYSVGEWEREPVIEDDKVKFQAKDFPPMTVKRHEGRMWLDVAGTMIPEPYLGQLISSKGFRTALKDVHKGAFFHNSKSSDDQRELYDEFSKLSKLDHKTQVCDFLVKGSVKAWLVLFADENAKWHSAVLTIPYGLHETVLVHRSRGWKQFFAPTFDAVDGPPTQPQVRRAATRQA